MKHRLALDVAHLDLLQLEGLWFSDLRTCLNVVDLRVILMGKPSFFNRVLIL